MQYMRAVRYIVQKGLALSQENSDFAQKESHLRLVLASLRSLQPHMLPQLALGATLKTQSYHHPTKLPLRDCVSLTLATELVFALHSYH